MQNLEDGVGWDLAAQIVVLHLQWMCCGQVMRSLWSCFVVLVVFWLMVANWYVYFYAEQQNQYLNTVLLKECSSMPSPQLWAVTQCSSGRG